MGVPKGSIGRTNGANRATYYLHRRQNPGQLTGNGLAIGELATSLHVHLAEIYNIHFLYGTYT